MKKIYTPASSLVSIFLLFNLIAADAQSQSPFAYDEISFLFQETGIGSRALGMGGAYIALGDDYSSLYWNPAGLGLMKSHEFYASISQKNANIKSNFLNTNFSEDFNKTSINAIGIAYSANAYQGSLVFAAGYNKVHNYNSLFGYSAFNTGDSYMGMEFSEPFAPNNLTQDESVENDGHLGQYSFGFSVEVAPNVFFGAAMNIWHGENTYSQIYRETDTQDLYTVLPDDFDNYRYDSNITTGILGYGMTLGVLYRLKNNIRLGATIQTPRYLRLTEEWSFIEDITFDNGDYEPVTDDAGTFEFNVRTPFIFGGGIAYLFGSGAFSAEFNYIDWTQFRFSNDFPIDDVSTNEANLNIRRTLRWVISPKFGFEYELPNTRLKLRAGFGMIPSPVKDTDDANNRKIVSTGIGFALSPSAHLDLTYRRSWWEQASTNAFNGVIVDEKHNAHHFFTAIYIRF